jgi:hypothetical protein
MATSMLARVSADIPTGQQIASMGPGPLKVYENRVRRIAARQLLALHRTRRRDRLAHDFGTYRVVKDEGRYLCFAEREEIALAPGPRVSRCGRSPTCLGRHAGP